MATYQELLEKALDLLEIGVYIYTPQGRAVYMNKKARETMGFPTPSLYQGSELLKINDITPEESTTLSCIREQKEIRNRLCRYKTMDGKEHYTFNTAYPVFEDGALTAAVDFEEDVFWLEKRKQLIEQLQRRAQNQVLSDGTVRKKQLHTLDDFIGTNPAVLELKKNIRKVASQDSNILIYGETGTGKEILAQSIHGLSRRRDKPLVVLNCAAVTESLVESILFGTVAGAYTGATNRKGLLEAANGGTLFLDELNSMPLPMQAKLLRVLQEGVFRRVGETREREVDIRVISACNQEPLQLLRDKVLREDLFYRLATMVLRIPPLRDRIDDLELLCSTYLASQARYHAYPLTRIAPKALWKLQQYSWPGNVRELFHVLDYAMNLSEGDELTDDLLPEVFRTPSPASPPIPATVPGLTTSPQARTLAQRMAAYEISILEETLRRNRGNITQSARELGLQRQNLQYRLRKYHIDIKNGV